jgi:hypothetical protein
LPRVNPNVPSVRFFAAMLIGADIVIVICTGFVVWMELMGLNLVMALIIVVLTVGIRRIALVLPSIIVRVEWGQLIKGRRCHASSNLK